jgi:predicted dehydrogenase
MSDLFDSSRRRFIGTAGVVGFSLLSGGSGGQQIPLAPPDKQPPNLAVPEASERTVGWAIVGLGELALGEVMPAFGECRLSKPVALVSGHRDKAEKVARAYGIEPANIYDYENYDRLRDNPDVQAIYIVLPNSMHAEYTIRGARAGKHVLCEKPMAANVAECEQMIAAAREAQRKLMIAYRLRYEPFNMKAIEICQKQELGPIQMISASHGQNVAAPNIRLSRDLAGGPLGDVGVYCLNAARYLTGEEPIEVSAMSHQPKDDPRFREVPASVVWTMRFKSGVLAHCDCGFNVGESRRYRVLCQDGYLDMDPAFSYRGLKLRTRRGQQTTEHELEPANHFAAEMEHFSECVLQNQNPRTPGEEGLADMRVMAAIEESAAAGHAVKLGSA